QGRAGFPSRCALTKFSVGPCQALACRLSLVCDRAFDGPESEGEISLEPDPFALLILGIANAQQIGGMVGHKEQRIAFETDRRAAQLADGDRLAQQAAGRCCAECNDHLGFDEADFEIKPELAGLYFASIGPLVDAA